MQRSSNHLSNRIFSGVFCSPADALTPTRLYHMKGFQWNILQPRFEIQSSIQYTAGMLFYSASRPEILSPKLQIQPQTSTWESFGFFQDRSDTSRPSKIQSHVCIKAKEEENKSAIWIPNKTRNPAAIWSCRLMQQHISTHGRLRRNRLPWLGDLSAHCWGLSSDNGATIPRDKIPKEWSLGHGGPYVKVVTGVDCAATVTAVRSTFSHNWIMKWNCLFTCLGQEEPAAFTTHSCQSSVISKKALI